MIGSNNTLELTVLFQFSPSFLGELDHAFSLSSAVPSGSGHLILGSYNFPGIMLCANSKDTTAASVAWQSNKEIAAIAVISVAVMMSFV